MSDNPTVTTVGRLIADLKPAAAEKVSADARLQSELGLTSVEIIDLVLAAEDDRFFEHPQIEFQPAQLTVNEGVWSNVDGRLLWHDDVLPLVARPVLTAALPPLGGRWPQTPGRAVILRGATPV